MSIHFACAFRTQTFVWKTDMERLRTTPTSTDSGQLRATLDDSETDNTVWTYLPEFVPKLSELVRNQLQIFANITRH